MPKKKVHTRWENKMRGTNKKMTESGCLLWSIDGWRQVWPEIADLLWYVDHLGDPYPLYIELSLTMPHCNSPITKEDDTWQY